MKVAREARAECGAGKGTEPRADSKPWWMWNPEKGGYVRRYGSRIMRRTFKLFALLLVVASSAGLTGCIVVPDDGYGYHHHHHWDRDGDRGGHYGRDWR